MKKHIKLLGMVHLNIRHSFKTLKTKRVHCLGHKLHLTVCNALCLWVKEPEVSRSSISGEASDKNSNKDINTIGNNSNNSRGEYQKYILLSVKKHICRKNIN